MQITRTVKRFYELFRRSKGLAGKACAIQSMIYYLLYRLTPLSGSRVFSICLGDGQFDVDMGRHELAGLFEVVLEREYDLDGRWIPGTKDIVFDVGANIGAFTILQAKRACAGLVFAFEPSPTTFQRLRSNVENNSLQNVRLFSCALGARPGVVDFIDLPVSLNSRVSTGASDSSAINVTCESLDSVVTAHKIQRIDLLKIDTEGYEVPILQGGLASALGITRRIVLEVHNCADTDLIRGLLLQEGFELVARRGIKLFYERRSPTCD